jgi:energy-coupling factor transporter ATP-binding protein EcfA2
VYRFSNGIRLTNEIGEVIGMVQPDSKDASEATGDELLEILPLVAERVVVLHGTSSEATHLRGNDLDCIVVGLDSQWPLRMARDLRLCQYIQYDVNGWMWAIERQGHVVFLDTFGGARGLGRYGFPTTLLDEEDLHPSPSLRAAYLTAKRLQKGITTVEEWERISRLAQEDPEEYARILQKVVGPRSSPLLAEAVLGGRQPGPEMTFEVRRERFRRRFGSPGKAVTAITSGGRRGLNRLLLPTGCFIVLVGADGTGKSTLAQALHVLMKDSFRRSLAFHWRPGLLPRPGSLIGREGSDPQKPHARSPYGLMLSGALLGYYWLDSFLGGWLRILPFRARTGMITAERGWWDLAVDPRRYRLTSPPWLVRALGFLLLRPDLVLLLEAPPQAILERKSEISREELERQASAWNSVFPTDVAVVRLDASRPAVEVAKEARARILEMLERRAISRLGRGWSRLPSRSSARWIIPRGPKETARASLRIYHPVTTRARLAWEAAQLGAAVGCFRLVPRGDPPPRSVRQILAPHIPRGGTLAVTRANHEGRYIALILDGHGRCLGVAKVARGEEGDRALEREAGSIERFRVHLPPLITPPTILERSPGLLLLEPVSWRPRWRAWHLDEEVAGAMGAFFRSTRTEGPEVVGGAHGDWAPWNMLRTSVGWVLVDWEDASDAAPPFYDLCHHLVQSHALLGRPTLQELLHGFRHGDGWVGNAVRSYAQEAHENELDAQSFLIAYLQMTEGKVWVGPKSEAAAAARRTLLARLKG